MRSSTPAFAVGTGDYAFGVLTVGQQLDAYAKARAEGLGDADVFALACKGGTVSIQAFFIRGGQNWGHRAFFPSHTQDVEDGQVLADHDFGSVSVVGRDPLVLDYQISDKAVYSDGKPVTCDDMVLTWAAQSGRFPAFDSASRAGYIDIAGVECQPGQKKARASFAVDRNFADYGQLFTATSMMPSSGVRFGHALARRASCVRCRPRRPTTRASPKGSNSDGRVEDWRAGLGRCRATFPAPSTSNAACGFVG